MKKYWEIKLSDCKSALEGNHFSAYIAETAAAAKKIVIDRICNVWTIHERSYPKGRIQVILINQDLGL